jgi:monovalent cation:H+ antiporter, CPA1 family
MKNIWPKLQRYLIIGALLVTASIFITSKAFAFSHGEYSSLLNAGESEFELGENTPGYKPRLAEENEGEEEQIMVVITAVIGLLLVASLVGIVANRLRLPYTVGLVLIGLALSLSMQGQEMIEIPPEIFLGLLVPPLIFEAAFHIRARDLFDDLIPILALAIPGVLITTFLVGGVVAWGTGFSLATALVFGSLVAATDPVAVVALFRTLGVPKRLQVLLEGESLFNDGTAIVVFNLMVVIAVSGVFDPLSSIIDFLVVAGGGLAVGFILAVLISQAIRFIDDDMIETTLTTVLAFGAYIIAEQFHVSGVLAVVVAGLVSGNIGPKAMSPSSRMMVFNFWEYAAFMANSVVFLLIGLQINLRLLVADWQVIAWAILAVLVARAVGVYGLSWIGKGVPTRYKHVLYWGGLRGAISLALALSLPATLGPDRAEIQAMAFGVVLFTLLVQGLTMKPLINKIGLIDHNELKEEYERRQARSVMAKTSYERLQEMHQEGLLPTHLYSMMSKPIKQHAEALAKAVSDALHADPEIEAEIVIAAMRELVLTQRSSLSELVRDGIISEEVFTQLSGEVDTALANPSSNIVELMLHGHGHIIRGLMTVMVQESDEENVLSVLNRMGIPVTRLSSVGGFLARKNSTLLVGVPDGQELDITQAISKASRQRVEFLPSIIEDNDVDTSVTIGGATIFTFEVERFEEI